MKIDPAAPVVASHEIRIEAPLQRIWSFLTAINRWPGWNPAIESARLNGALEVGATFEWKSGGITIVSTLREIQDQARFAWTGNAFGTRAIHVWSLQPTPTGVLVSTSESIDGWLARLMRKAMQRSVDAALAAWLAELKRRVEGGR